MRINRKNDTHKRATGENVNMLHYLYSARLGCACTKCFIVSSSISDPQKGAPAKMDRKKKLLQLDVQMKDTKARLKYL